MEAKQFLSLSIVFIVAMTVQSSNLVNANNVENDLFCARRMQLLVGDTETSINNLPFSWATEYEVAVMYLTSKWSEIKISNKTVVETIFRNNYLTYSHKLTKILLDFKTKVNANSKETEVLKNDVVSWHQHLVDILNDNGALIEDGDLAYYQKKFQNGFRHLVVKAKNVASKTNLEETKQDIDVVAKQIIDMLMGTIKNISVEFDKHVNKIQ